MLPEWKRRNAQELTICNLAIYIVKGEGKSFEAALFDIKKTKLYDDIMHMLDPAVCTFPPEVIQHMYEAEKGGNNDEYDEWLCSR